MEERSRIARFATSRAERLERQWGAFGPFVARLVIEECRALGEDIDALVAPVKLSAERNLEHSARRAVSFVPKILAAGTQAANRLP
jgi:hypothetical protein